MEFCRERSKAEICVRSADEHLFLQKIWFRLSLPDIKSVDIVKKRIDTIIWDWNGTLLNDIDICISGINKLLRRRSLPDINESRYKEIFTFPVKDYYTAAGFDFEKEPFEVPAEEFIVEYQLLFNKAELFHDTVEVLAFFQENGFRQFVLSAMEQDALVNSLKFHHISQYFDGIFGIADNLAVSKIDRGREMINLHQIDEETSVIVGDTLHDVEVSKDLGIDMILIGRGHQNPARLTNKGYPVFDNLTQVRKLLAKYGRNGLKK